MVDCIRRRTMHADVYPVPILYLGSNASKLLQNQALVVGFLAEGFKKFPCESVWRKMI